MRAAGEGLGHPQQAVRRVYGPSHRWLLSLLLGMIGVTAIVAVVVAGALGQTTVALVIGLVSGAFFAGMMC